MTYEQILTEIDASVEIGAGAHLRAWLIETLEHYAEHDPRALSIWELAHSAPISQIRREVARAVRV